MAIKLPAKLMVENNSKDELISYLFESIKITDSLLSKAIDEQNIGIAGEASQSLILPFRILQELDEEINGKKPRTVVQ